VARRQAGPGGGGEAVGDGGQAKLGVELAGGARQEGPEQDREDAADFGEVVKHLVQAAGLGRVLGQFEGGGVVDVLVGARDQRPDGQERGLELIPVEAGAG